MFDLEKAKKKEMIKNVHNKKLNRWGLISIRKKCCIWIQKSVVVEKGYICRSYRISLSNETVSMLHNSTLFCFKSYFMP